MKDMPEDRKTQCFTHADQGCDGTYESAERTDHTQAENSDQKPETD